MTRRQIIMERFNHGDLARAYDLCLDGIRERPDDLWLKHRAVLCLLRSNALERAEADYERFQLSHARHDEDCMALGARLLKALAFEASAPHFKAAARAAADKYVDVFARTGGHYPGVNAATMAFLAGQSERSEGLARAVVERCRASLPAKPEAAYYQLASQAEASLLLGQSGAAQMAFLSAVSRDPENFSAHATTLRQLRLIARLKQLDLAWLEQAGPPRPAHFAGHIFESGDGKTALDNATLERLNQQIEDALSTEHVGVLHGALAAGSDILIAEAGLRAGCELAVVLPVPTGVFIDASVRPFGDAWVKRCEACLGAADSIREMTSDRRIVSELNLNYSSTVAMGLTRIRSEALAASPLQILIQDERGSAARSGTARDAEIWRRTGLPQVRIPIVREVRPQSGKAQPAPEAKGAAFRPVMRAMLFLDVRGSTTVPDDQVPVFVETVLGRLAQICRAQTPAPSHADSWGDGMFLAFERVGAAARAAEELRRAFAAIDLNALELPSGLGLRIAGHYGPVHEGLDPLQGRASPFGGQVAIASRIEGVTTPGSIFVSEAFAAVLAISGETGFQCEYVGQTQIDSLLPEVPLYALRAVAEDSLLGGGRALSAGTAKAVQEIGVDELDPGVAAP
ncbi:tetratricopeptide repeat-containing protein [Maricaulis sp. CAU 1757]